MKLIQRTLVGVVIGLAYGFLVGGSLALVSFAAGDSPVDMMIDYGELFRFLILLATIISCSAGVFVGLIVTLLGVDRLKAGTIGFGVGLLIIAGIVFTIWPQLKNEWSGMDSVVELRLVFAIFLVLFIIFPIGLATTGLMAVKMSGKFASR